MAGGNSSNITISRTFRIDVPASHQEIPQEHLVKFPRDFWHGPQYFQRVTKTEDSPHMSIVKRPGSDEVSCAPQVLFPGIPQREGEVSNHALKRAFAPFRPGPQKKLFTCGTRFWFTAIFGKLLPEFLSAVQTDISPQQITVLPDHRLLRSLWRRTCPHQHEAATDVAPRPDLFAVGPTEAQFIGDPFQRSLLDGLSVLPHYAEKTAHSFSPGKSEKPLSNAA